MSLKQREMTFKPRIKLKHNIHTLPEEQKLMTIIILIIIFCRQMGSGMSYSIEDAKSRYNVND